MLILKDCMKKAKNSYLVLWLNRIVFLLLLIIAILTILFLSLTITAAFFGIFVQEASGFVCITSILLLMVLLLILFLKISKIGSCIKEIFGLKEGNRRSSIKRLILNYVGLFTIYCISSFVVVTYARWIIKEEITKLEKQSLPTSFLDLYRSGPSGSNAAPEMQRFLEEIENKKELKEVDSLLKRKNGSTEEFKDFLIRKWSQSEQQEVKKFLKLNYNLLMKLENIIDSNTYYQFFDVKKAAEDPPNTPLPKISKCIELSKQLALKAKTQLLCREHNEVLKTLKRITKFAEFLSDEPDLLAKAIALAIQNINAKAIAATFNILGTDKVFQESRATLGKLAEKNLVAEGIKGELCYAIDLYRHCTKTYKRSSYLLFEIPFIGEKTLANAIVGFTLYRTGYIDFSFWKIIDYDHKLVEMYNSSVRERISNSGKMSIIVEKLAYWPFIITKIAIPKWSAFYGKETKHDLMVSLLDVIKIIREYHRKIGIYPSKIDDLIGFVNQKDILTDPFSGQMLHLKHMEKGLVIYSIGEDLVDDAGDLTSDKDIGYTIDKVIEIKK